MVEKNIIIAVGAVIGAITLLNNNNDNENSRKIDLDEVNDFKKKVIQSDESYLVFFSASYCPACKYQNKILESETLEKENNIVKITTSGRRKTPELEKLFDKYNIRSLPTWVVFKNGKEIKKFPGVKSKNKLDEIIKKYL